MWLLFLLAGNSIWLQNGKVIQCDRYERVGERVVVTEGKVQYSMPQSKINWKRTERTQDEPLLEEANSRSRIVPLLEENGPQYSGFVIQHLDVRKTSLIDLIRFLADMVGINLYIDSSVKDVEVTYMFKNTPWDQVMTLVLYNAGLSWDMQTSDLLAVR